MRRTSQAIEEVMAGEAPCDQCPSNLVCASSQVACKDFHFYVDTGKVQNVTRDPVHKYFKLLFPDLVRSA